MTKLVVKYTCGFSSYAKRPKTSHCAHFPNGKTATHTRGFSSYTDVKLVTKETLRRGLEFYAVAGPAHGPGMAPFDWATTNLTDRQGRFDFRTKFSPIFAFSDFNYTELGTFGVFECFNNKTLFYCIFYQVINLFLH